MEEAAKSILIIEDEAIISMEIEAALRSLGYRIAGKARNGDKALDLLASAQPDLALLDIELKGSLSGIDLARVIREKYDFPFVFLTAFSDRATLDSLRDTLPYGYIVKPFNESDLYTTIEIALDKFAAEKSPSFPTLDQINERIIDPLTKREYETLQLLNDGLSYREIGERLFLSINTIKSYQKGLFAKFGASSRHEVVSWVRDLAGKHL